jgi:hypothetical protein
VLFLPTVFLCGLGIWLVIIRDTRRDGTENVTRNLSAFWEFGASPITLKNTVFFLAMITIVCTLCQIILPPADWQCVALKFFDDVSPGNGKAILHNFLGFYGKGMIFLLLISFLSSETKKTRSRNIF